MAGKVIAKKKEKTQKSYPPGANGYYLDIAAKLGKAKWAVAICLAVTVLVCVVFAGGELTFQNAKYFLKHLDANSEGNEGNFSTLKFESDASYTFGYYKDDFVIVNSTGIKYFDMKGKPTASENLSMSDPHIVSTEKYLIVYDQGNVSYSVFDSFVEVESNVTEYPIRDLAACDEGSFVIVSRDLEYRGVAYVYDRNFNLKSKILKDKLIFDATISRDGSRFCVLSGETADNGEFYTEIQSLIKGAGEAEFTKVVDDCFPISATYFDDGNLGVLCQDRFLVLNKGGGIVAEYMFNGVTPTSCAYGGNTVAIAYNENVIGINSNILILNSGAEVIKELNVNGQVKKIILDDSYAYTLLTDSVARIGISDGEVTYEHAESNPLDVLVRDEESLLLCYSNRVDAIQYAFTGINEEE